ncbi:MAG: hypothetical protein JWM56_852 [Candidatus Peribacteria bacterium]|nr:hypothetical protein [Candidatus Peribacteria bacterium]
MAVAYPIVENNAFLCYYKTKYTFSRRMKHTHKHFLVAPLFAALVLATVITPAFEVQSLTASVLQGEYVVGRNDQLLSFPDSVRLLAAKDTTISMNKEQLFLVQGTALIYGKSLVHIHTGSADIEGLHGGFSVTSDANSLTIVALTTPVLVTIGRQRTMVPAGRQWKTPVQYLPGMDEGLSQWLAARRTHPLPVSFLAEQLVRLHTLSDMSDTLAAVSMAQEQQQVFAQLQAALGSITTLHELVRSIDVQSDILNTPSFAGHLAALLPVASAPAQKELIAVLSRQSDFWLLASFHADFYDTAWLQPASLAAHREDEFLRLIFFPEADAFRKESAPSVHARFESDLQYFLQADNAPAAMTQLFTTVLQEAVDSLHARGYPYREALYNKDIVQLSSGYLPEEEHTVAPEVQEESVPSAGAVSAASSSVPVCAPKKSSAEQLAAVKTLLSQWNALLTVHTVISATNLSVISVQSVVIPSASSGDHLYNFDVDVSCGKVLRIQKEGVDQPYALTVEQFWAWAK